MTTPWKIRLGREAEKDFANILAYTRDTFGPQQAEIYKQTLIETLASLSEAPMALGSVAREEILPGLRTLPLV